MKLLINNYNAARYSPKSGLSKRRWRKAAGKNIQVPFYKKLLLAAGLLLALVSINDPRFGMRKLYEPYSKEKIEKPGRVERAGERVGGDHYANQYN